MEAVASHFEGVGRRVSRLRVSHAFHSPLMEPMLDDFRAVVGGLAWSEPVVPVVSNVTGAVAGPGLLSDPEYWVGHVREAVRFADGVRALRALGVSRFVECGPDAVLTGLARQVLDHDNDAGGEQVVFASMLRGGRAEDSTAVTALAELFASGADVDWDGFYAGRDATRTDLPTYAFQRKRYWIDAQAGAGNITSAGLDTADHPLLGAAITLADNDGIVLTGRLSADALAWVGDNDVLGSVLFPTAGFVDLALSAGEHVGCDGLSEFRTEVPLVLTGQTAPTLQVSVGAADESGARRVTVHSRSQDVDTPDVLHGTGTLTTGADASPAADLTVWPPAGALAMDVEEAQRVLFERGYGHGAALGALSALWRRGDEVFAELTLDAEEQAAEGCAVHPALLEAAGLLRHVAVESDNAATLPRVWTGVSRRASGTATLRACLARTSGADGADSVALDLADAAGDPVLSVRSLTAAPVTEEQLARTAAGTRPNSLYRLTWQDVSQDSAASAVPTWAVLGDPDPRSTGEAHTPSFDGVGAFAEAVERGDTAEQTVLLAARTAAEDSKDVLAGTRSTLDRVREAMHSWVTDLRLGAARLVVVTEGAVAARDARGLTQAALRGLVTSAQAEHPGRFGLVDLDGSTESRAALPAALAVVNAGEPDVAVREGRILVSRLRTVEPVPRSPSATSGESTLLSPSSSFSSSSSWAAADGTVVVTVGVEGHGAPLARHLVDHHDVRHLLLLVDESAAVPDTDALEAEGVQVTRRVCDLTDREAVSRALAAVPAEHPVRAVVHTAATASNGLFEAMDRERVESALLPRAGAAWHLHELTRDHSLTAFVLLSSSTGLLHGVGQANQAAAATFLDALARHRRAQGLPALSLAFGPWNTGAVVPEEEVVRARELGIPYLDADEGTELFDRALALALAPTDGSADDEVLFPLRLDHHALRARAEELPAPLRGLVRAPRRPSGADTGRELRRRLGRLSPDERVRRLLDLVRAQVAAVLGHASAATVEPDRAFKDLGFDSLAAVELRRRLDRTTGLSLSATLVFDHPTSRAAAEYIDGLILPDADDSPAQEALGGIDRLEAVLAALASGSAGRDHERITSRLEALLRTWRDTQEGGSADEPTTDYESATDDELFDVLDSELGIA
ncbi:KR domain-containing protein [Streptomyces sp. MS06]|uniref:KR domain-containing protein n=1 Tax=Streptomyces sp. MS06 TaxID=3385974 RepID=UPI0039A0610D